MNEQQERSQAPNDPQAMPSVLIQWDQAVQNFRLSFSGNMMPIPALVNQLEVLKAMLVNQQLAAMAQAAERANQQKLVVPNGQRQGLKL